LELETRYVARQGSTIGVFGHNSEGDFSVMYRTNKRSLKFAVNLNSQVSSCQRNGKVYKTIMQQWTGNLLN